MVARLVVALACAAALLGAALAPTHSQDADHVALRILAVNDLHGALDTGREIGRRPIGGAAYLATHLRAHGAGQEGVLVVGAGDMIGASPPLSGLLRDEPTIRVMNALGFLLNAPGNHEFDRGTDEFFRLANGGCRPATGCFEGARFKHVSANIVVEATGEPLLPPYHVEAVQGIPVAFVGATHADVRTTVIAGAVDGLTFPRPADAVNRYVGQLKEQGIRAVVVVIHEGGDPHPTAGLAGPIARTVQALDPEVDVVISAHSHVGYATRFAGKLVTQAYSHGTAFVEIDLRIDRATRDVVSARAELVGTYNDEVEPDPTVQAIVQEAEAQVAPLVARVVGHAARELTAQQNRAGESALGNLIADAHRWRMGAQVAVTNTGGIRAPLKAGPVTWGELFTIQPFSNELIAMTIGGEQLWALFEQQWTVQPDGAERFRPLQPSGIRVTWDGRRPRGARIVSLSLDDGTPVERAGSYRVAANSFMAGGGGGLEVLAGGDDRQVGSTDLDALVEYVEQLPQPFEARIEGRISRLD